MNRLIREYRVFLSCPRDMRLLLIANMIFTLIMPVIDIFVAAYVMRNSHDVAKVVIFQLAVYTGIPCTFFLNGFLLRLVSARSLYAFGMLLTGASIAAMMSTDNITPFTVSVCGMFLGVATGFFAANRGFLALATTNDRNRNYYYGVEMFFYTMNSVLVPAAVGWLVEGTAAYGWFGGQRNNAYQVVAAAVCGLAILSAIIVRKGHFADPPKSTFLHVRFHPLWYRMLWLAVLKGLAQGYIVTAPAMLILMLVGQEGALGSVEAVGGILSSMVLYGVGRLAEPRHRLYVLAAGLSLFAVGGLFNTFLFNAAGALILTFCLLLSKPLLDVAYFPIQFLVTDVVAAIEGRNQFAYIFNHECAEYVGRLLGCSLFIVLAWSISGVAALKYALPVVGAAQMLSLIVARSLLGRLRSGNLQPGRPLVPAGSAAE